MDGVRHRDELHRSTSDVDHAQNLTFTGVTPSYIAGNALQWVTSW